MDAESIGQHVDRPFASPICLNELLNLRLAESVLWREASLNISDGILEKGSELTPPDHLAQPFGGVQKVCELFASVHLEPQRKIAGQRLIKAYTERAISDFAHILPTTPAGM